jgi:hypothetical protein
MTPFATKIAIVLRDDLATWQRLNVTAYLASGIAGTVPELLGEEYRDADGTRYAPMFGQPVLVFAADRQLLASVHARAVGQGLLFPVFTQELFHTGNDADNRAAVRAVPREKLDLAGLALHGPRKVIDKVLKGVTLHR